MNSIKFLVISILLFYKAEYVVVMAILFGFKNLPGLHVQQISIPNCRTSITFLIIICHLHRRTGNFRQRGAVNHLPKKFLQVAQIFTKQSKRNEGHTMQQHRTGIWKCLNTVFQGQYLLSLNINYVAINKHLEKLPPQLY